MALKHDEFYNLTPLEFAELYEGYKWREEREWYKLAWLAHYTIAPHVKKAPTPDDLLGRSRMPKTKDEKAADFAKLWEKHQKKLQDSE